MPHTHIISFSIHNFGEYALPAGTSLTVLTKELTTQLGLHRETTHPLFANGTRVGQRAVVGRWPLVTGATLSFEEPEHHDELLSIVSASHIGYLPNSAHAELMRTRVGTLSEVEAHGLSITRRSNHTRLRAPLGRVILGRVRVGRVRLGRMPVDGTQADRTLREDDAQRERFVVLQRMWAATRAVRLISGGIPVRDGLILTVRGKYTQPPVIIETRDPAHVNQFQALAEQHAFDTPPAPDATTQGQPSENNPGNSLTGTLLSAGVPLVMSAVLAIVMKQPLFLLFALSGPILILTQFALRRKSAGKTTDIESLPRWLQRGVRAETLSDALLVRELCTQLDVPPPHTELPQHAREAFGAPLPVATAQRLAAQLIVRSRVSPGSVRVIALRSAHRGWLWLRWLRPQVFLADDPTHLISNARQAFDELAGQDCGFVVVAGPTEAAVFDGLGVYSARDVNDVVSAIAAGGIGSEAEAEADADAFNHLASYEKLVRICSAASSAQQEGHSLPAIAPLIPLLSIPGAQLGNPSGNPTTAPPAWDSNPVNSCAIPIGIGSDGVHTLDLVKQGPHMLVAGTTGAGKSEFLQSLVLAAAHQFSVHELNLVLVDYKGGAGLAPCARLPHSVGMVTDLDPSEAVRALHGLRSELKRREHLLADSEVADLARYNVSRVPADRLPRLLIVVDEFRALSDDQPEFIPQLVRLAAQGRSLGMHLVLATQRPAGAITADMKANISLRVCLRVADEQDSLDVVGTTSGAHIPTQLPGRLLVKVGSNTPELVQSYYAGSTQNLPPRIYALNGWHVPVGLTNPHLGEPEYDPFLALQRAHEAARHGVVRPLWAPSLPEEFTWLQVADGCSGAAGSPRAVATGSGGAAAGPSGAAGDTASVVVPVLGTQAAHGLTPVGPALLASENHNQHNIGHWHTQSGNLLVLGAAQRGKTTALLACALQPRAEQHNRSGVGIAHWIGQQQEFTAITAAFAQQSDFDLVNTIESADSFKIHALLRRLVSPTSQSHESPLALETQQQIRVIIDDFEAVRTALETFDRGSGIAYLEALLRDGPSRGIFVAVSNTRNLTGQFQHYFTQRVVLSSGNKESDTVNGAPRALLPLPAVRGRGIWITPESSTTCHIRNPFGALPRYEDSVHGTKHSTVPHSLKPHSAELVWSLAEYPALPHDGILVGFSPVPLQVQALPVLLVLGNRRTGRTTTLKVLRTMLAGTGHRIAVIDARSSDCEEQARKLLSQLENGEQPHSVMQLDNLEVLEAQHQVLAQQLLTAALKQGLIVHASSTPAAMTSAFRGPLAELREHETALLLDPRQGRDRELFSTNISSVIDPALMPGKAVFCQEGIVLPARIDHA